MRKFEKISLDQFCKDIVNDENLYNNYELPTRSTKHSAGYDFKSPIDFTIKPGEFMKVPTGVKAIMNNDEMLMIYVRSSMGLKHQIRMLNTVGIIDSDYYNNPDNEGHMYITLKNEGNHDYVIKVGEKFGQGIFTKFLTVDDEEEIAKTRTGGFGSTTKGEK